jgi:hypothetical protein
MAPKQA